MAAACLFWKFFDVQVTEGIDPLPGAVLLLIAGSVETEQADDVINIDPDFRIAFLLAFVKDQLHAKMQVHRFDIICILFVRRNGNSSNNKFSLRHDAVYREKTTPKDTTLSVVFAVLTKH